MSAESEGVILSQSDVSIATLYQMFLCITLISFVFTLVLPKGLRRALLGSNKKRYVYSSWVKNAQITKTRIGKEIPKRENYVTLKEINTSDSLCFATLMDNDELSPLDCVEIGHGYQSIFRTKSAKKRTKSAKKPAPESSSKYHSIFDYNSPTDSVATSFVSTGIYSPPSEFFNEGEDNAGGTESAPPRIPLSERRELHSNITSQNVTGTPKLKTPAKMDYSPSPLSIVSTSFDVGLVVLIAGDKSIQDANENSSIELLRSKGLKYYIVDAMDPLQSKRREDLVFASGIIGHYPQIFYVNDQRRATYMGNHEALFNLEKQGILNQSSLRKSVKGENWNDAVGGGLDSSYFSV